MHNVTVSFKIYMSVNVFRSIGTIVSELRGFHCFKYILNSSPLSSAYMRLWTWSALVQIMACHSVPSHYLKECWVIVNWTLSNKLQWHLIKIQSISFTKMHLKISSAKRWSFCPGRDELNAAVTFPWISPCRWYLYIRKRCGYKRTVGCKRSY